MSGVRQLPSEELSGAEVAELRALLDFAFIHDEDGAFLDSDWDHALGGRHFLFEADGRIVSHAAVVERDIHVGGRLLRTGYVEAVGTLPAEHGRGYGTAVMRQANAWILANFELGALGTGSHGFYTRLGWQTWRGPSFVRTPEGDAPTPDDDGYIMVLATPSSPALDLDAPISCAWRVGDVW